jgi:hypothetical protein
MEPRLAFALGGYAVDVMRAALWMKEDRNAQEFLNLPSSMRLALEEWGRALGLLKELEESFRSLSFESLSVHKRPVAILEADIEYFAPVSDPPAIRYFDSFSEKKVTEFDFGQPQTLLGHKEAVRHAGLSPRGEIAAVVAVEKGGGSPTIAGYSVFNNWIDHKQRGGLAFGKASSMGPWLITADEVESHKMGTGLNLDMQLRVNGEAFRNSRFSKMNFSFSEMLQVSSETRLMAGDILCSGSPVVDRLEVKESDQVDLEIQALGVLQSSIG